MDKQNFEQRVRILWPAMVRTARCLVRDASDAEDAAAQAVLRCWQNLLRLREENAFEAWAMRACVNEAKMILRKQRRVQPRSDLWQAMAHSPGDARSEGSWSGGGFAGSGWPGDGWPSDGWPGDELTLHELLMRLPERDRLPLSLMYASDMPLNQIATALGVSRGTAASRISRARKKLKAILEQEGYVYE